MNYQHREQLYQSVKYRGAYDRLVADHGERPGIIEYLHLLNLGIGFPFTCYNWRVPKLADGQRVAASPICPACH